jgi:catechol 2,3-dioxygenase-like lactoylglutathione lyase family enzyme
MGGVDIELIQPAEGPSLYQEFLDSKGDGIHHIAFSVDDVDESVANLAKQGIGVSFSGKWQGGGFAYVETDAVGGIIIELLQGYKKKEMDKNLVDSPFSNFIHVGVVVKDLDKTIEFLSSLGIGPFEIPVVPPLKGTSSFRGKPYPSFAGKLKTKRAKMGGFELHLYQPVEGETPFKEFLDLKGEGIHHLAFHVDDIDKEFARLTKHDIGVLFEGKWNVGGFTYFETPVGGLVLELEQI